MLTIKNEFKYVSTLQIWGELAYNSLNLKVSFFVFFKIFVLVIFSHKKFQLYY